MHVIKGNQRHHSKSCLSNIESAGPVLLLFKYRHPARRLIGAGYWRLSRSAARVSWLRGGDDAASYNGQCELCEDGAGA